MPNTRSFLVDARDAAELLVAGRPPKQLSYLKKLPFTQKLWALANKAGSQFAASETGNPWSELAKSLLRGATQVAMSKAAGKVLAGVAGKVATPVSSVQKVAAYGLLGANIVEEMDHLKLVRPWVEGASIDPAQAAKKISDTAMRHVVKSLIVGVPIASGIPTTVLKIFKTEASLKKSPRYFAGVAVPRGSPGVTEVIPVTSPDAVIPAQCGLLQDEIVYRLTLVAENVYAPIVNYVSGKNFPPVNILEGFRADNTGKSPHERGEAIDLTLGNGTLGNAEQVYELAQWCRDNIMYDQLILCYGDVGGGQVWLHVTLTPETNRRQVLTKPFNDAHVEGLHWYGVYTDAALLAQDSSTSHDQLTLSTNFMNTMAARDRILTPVAHTSTGTSDDTGAGTEDSWRAGPFLTPNPIYNDPYLVNQKITEGFLIAYGREPLQGERDQWFTYMTTPDLFSDNLIRQGWNEYWQRRLEDPGSAEAALGGEAFDATVIGPI